MRKRTLPDVPKAAALGLAIALLGACGSSGGGSGDASANLACTHFRNVAADASAGVLTDSELRTKLQQVYGDAKYSEDPAVAAGARQMLAAITSGDATALKSAVGRFDAACSAAGF